MTIEKSCEEAWEKSITTTRKGHNSVENKEELISVFYASRGFLLGRRQVAFLFAV